MGNVGLPEILVIAVIGLLVFGPRRLPEIARNAGRAIHEFKRVTGELTEELKAGLDEPATPPAASGAPAALTHTEMLPFPDALNGDKSHQAAAASGGSEDDDPPPGKDV